MLGHDEPLAPVTRSRVKRLVVLWLGGYALGVIFLGLATGFDHSTGRWLVTIAIAAIAGGSTARALLMIAVLIGDSRVRAAYWGSAGAARRAYRAVMLGLWVCVALAMWAIAGVYLVTGR
jgi:hypothetical protein